MSGTNPCLKLFSQNRRRRRTYLLNLFIISLCLCSIFPIKNHINHLSPKKHLSSNASCSEISSMKLILNCSGDPLKTWCKNEMNVCDSSMIIFMKQFFITHSAILQPNYAQGKRLGGEEIQEVLNQAEKDEYFHFEKNFLQLPCNIPKSIDISFGSHLTNVLSSITSYQTCSNIDLVINETTIAVNRHDYVNIYHTLTDLYTVYLLCRFFQRDPKSVRILFLDAHPKGNLDIYWTQLFHSFSRLGHMKNYKSMFYKELIWSQPQAQSEIDVQRHRSKTPSFFEDFRAHMLEQFHIDSRTNQTINCQSLQVFFLGRRNYVAHPRNPTGKITRQLQNEKEILENLQRKFSQYSQINFTYNYFEQLSIEEQLKTIVKTDVYIGMHGAGLTYVMLLKPYRALVELASSSWESQDHFELMASMNHVHYHRCRIHDGSSTMTETIFNCAKKKILQLCPSIMNLSPINSQIHR
ncbi:hypothetical protein I4U23_006932 [Adineta vaga]|nr:hypothetical protein I4U23_006932 [Adineta vaga]